ncbi:MAG TPA: hypothetical protein VFT82_00780 [Candidatus Paceibacterota bacterium]|nr:hypothetical protein [Candidatus Paceibacterota bacterium]
MSDNEINNDIINLVVARLGAIPPNVVMSIGDIEDSKTLTPADMIIEVKNKSNIGKKIIETQLMFLRSLKDLQIDPELYAITDN